MRRIMARPLAFVSLMSGVATLSWFSGCSLVNSFDSVTPQKPLGVVVVGGTIAGGAADQYVLTAIDPVSGVELVPARRPMTVASVQYDGVRDLWYVFESGTVGHFFPLPTDAFYLHVLRLDPVTGDWTELGATSLPPGLSSSTTAVLTNSVAYIAYHGGSAGDFDLVVVDTSHPAAIPPPSLLHLDAPQSQPVALLGAPGETDRVLVCATSAPSQPAADAGAAAPAPDNEAGADAAADALGDDDAGVVAEASGTGGPPASSEAGSPAPSAAAFSMLTEYFVSAGVASNPHLAVAAPGNLGPLVGFASVQRSGTEVPLVLVVSRAVGASQGATIYLYDPVQITEPPRLVSFPFTDPNVQRPAFSTCDGYAFVIGTDMETSIYTVNVGQVLTESPDGAVFEAQPPAQATMNSGQGLYFEPYTRTVLAPFSQGDKFKIWAFSLTLQPDGTPKLVERANWGPNYLRPNFLATKTPVPIPASLCPAVSMP